MDGALGLDDKTISDDEGAVMEPVPDYNLRTPALDEYDVLRMSTTNGALRHRHQ